MAENIYNDEEPEATGDLEENKAQTMSIRHLPQTAPVFNKLYLSVKWTLNCPSTCISITMLTVGFSDATPVF